MQDPKEVHVVPGPAPVQQEQHGEFAVSVRLRHDYECNVTFHDSPAPDITVDEHPPIGAGAGPNPARMLAASVGHCLGSSLLFCLRRARVDVQGLEVSVRGRLARNERGRLRVGELSVSLAPEVAEADRERMGRCLEIFEDFCIVTGSVRQGIDVKVEVLSMSAGQG